MTTSAEPIAYTVAEAARKMRCSANTVYRLASKGELRSVRVGRLMFITGESIAAFYDVELGRVQAAATSATK